MSAPRLESRRTKQFADELRERALAWMPSWGLAEGEGDFGRAILEIAARFQSEVAESLDKAGDKMRNGLLDWLGERGKAARPARMPVVFQLTDAARESQPTGVLAQKPVQMQADADGTPVVFETEQNVQILPAGIEALVAVDFDKDRFYLPPGGLTSLKPVDPLPTQWTVKSFVSAGSQTLQLDPEAGLVPDLLLEIGDRQYKVTKADKNLVTFEPSLLSDLKAGDTVTAVSDFAPFDGAAHNWQSHALYLGDMDLLNLESAAVIEVSGVAMLPARVRWEYWGKVDGSDEPAWQEFVKAEANGDSVTLHKEKGAIEPKEIDEQKSRWIRAVVAEALGKPFTSDQLTVRVNAKGCPADDTDHKCPTTALSPDTPLLVAEGMANTTPLVLERLFYPLGKEPRQFDAFYLGCEEAFSKQGATALVQFTIADRTFATLSTAQIGGDRVLIGVAGDGALYLLKFDAASGGTSAFRNRPPLRPPQPGFNGAANQGSQLQLDSQPNWRLPVRREADGGFSVAASANGTVWVWREQPDQNQASGWIDFGQPPSNDPSKGSIEGLVFLSDHLVALRGEQLAVRPISPPPNSIIWRQFEFTDSATYSFAAVLPILGPAPDGTLQSDLALGLIGLTKTGELFRLHPSGDRWAASRLGGSEVFDTDVRPVAFSATVGGPLHVVARQAKKLVLVGTTEKVALEQEDELGATLEVTAGAGGMQVLAAFTAGARSGVLSWALLETGLKGKLMRSIAEQGRVADKGSPLFFANTVVVPGTRADILSVSFNPANRFAGEIGPNEVASLVIAAPSEPAMTSAHSVARISSGLIEHRKIRRDDLLASGERQYALDDRFSVASTGLFSFRGVLNGVATAPDQLKLDSSDDATVDQSYVLINGHSHQVTAISAGRVATLTGTPFAGDETVTYLPQRRMNGRVTDYLRLDLSGPNVGWDLEWLPTATITFVKSGQNVTNQGTFIDTLSGERLIGLREPIGLALRVGWLIDAAFGKWNRSAGDTSANPELSWEYWNGRGWWRLDVTCDQTQNLKTSGIVQFSVPADITVSEWSGKNNFWIRARLIGGDFGQEKVTLETKPIPGGEEQTVKRSNEGIRPPLVLDLVVAYATCSRKTPSLLLTEDFGSYRNQSDANRTPGALVEAFIPLASAVGRLIGNPNNAPALNQQPKDCEPETTATNGNEALPVVAATRRALFLGCSGPLSGAPVNALFQVDERPHEAFAPLQVKALTAGRLTPVVADDATRALGESGILSMAFPTSTTLSQLFGGKPLHWVMLQPYATVGEWKPRIRAVYLNAAWASATETLTRELLGSSDGSPNLTVKLARPPVLDQSLELRVREPLGDEERAALKDLVATNVHALPGDWVLWRQVFDPLDEAPGERVYSLDESTGEIRFGDGLHGLIPPIGRDSIVAFRYQRTEPGKPGTATVPGNLVEARAKLNLVTPVESVESVTAAGTSAGGSPPEPAERVVRFGFDQLRHRNRVVTAKDMEDIVLGSSPDFAQACVLQTRPFVWLVVAMRGSQPQPNAAQIRELRRMLLENSPAELAAPGALRIKGPKTRQLRLDLTASVESLDRTGEVGRRIKERLQRFFDAAKGGPLNAGWPIGANPTPDDILFALSGLKNLESLEPPKRIEVRADRLEYDWPKSLQSNELVVLAADALRISFRRSEDASA